MGKIVDNVNSDKKAQQLLMPPVGRRIIQLLHFHSQSFGNPAMDDDGEVVNVSTDHAREGWDVLKSGNTRLRKRVVYETIEPPKQSSSVNFGISVVCRGCSFTAENGHKEPARY